MKHYKPSSYALAVALFFAAGTAQARDQLQIVGSSTVFPFSTAVAETLGKTTSLKTPVVEATGSGGGIKLFCAGVGKNTPDITNASRRIKEKEFRKCRENGVTPIEVQIGFDGIVLANSKKAERLSLTLRQVYLALAKRIPGPDGRLVDNPNKKWSDIDPSLPAIRIEVLGPPPTSGTRDAFEELAMGGGARTFASLKELRGLKAGDPRVVEITARLGLASGRVMKDGKPIKGKSIFKRIAHEIREDGAYIEAGENDNLIIQKLESNPDAVGIFGFSFLDQNSDRVQGALIDGVSPDFDNIADGKYRISRSLFFYVKKEHVGAIPGIQEYLAEFTKDGTWGNDGYLSEKGLIPLPEAIRKAVSVSVMALTPLSM